MMDNGKVKIGIAGCGYWGINYVRVFNELANSVVTQVCDQKSERLQLVKQRFPGIGVCNSVDELVKNGVDAVVIATQATAHFEVAKKCLENGKHLLMEKPITTNSDQAARLIDLADSKNRVLMVGHTFLFNDAVRATKQYLTSHEIGKIYYLHATRTNLGPIRGDVNAVWDLAPHDVSIFDYLLDETPEWVSAIGGCVLGNGREDVGFISLGYPNRVIGNIHVSWADPNKVREVVVVGSEMRIVFNDLDAQERVRVYNKGLVPVSDEAESFGEYHFLLRDGDIVSPVVKFGEPLKNQCSSFLECVQDGCCSFSNGETALEIVKVMEAIDKSMALHGTPVEV